VRAAARRLSNVMSPLGWSVMAAIPVTLIAGYTLGWLELVAAGWACVALTIVAVLVLIGRAPFEMTLAPPHRRAVVGDRASVVIEARNTSRRRTLAGVLEVPVGQEVAEVPLPGVRRGTTITHQVEIPTRRRGVIPVGPVRTVRADPLGLVRREL